MLSVVKTDTNIPLQPASKDIWKSKYQYESSKGKVVDKNVESMFKRVAKALAKSEKSKKKWEKAFYEAMMAGAIPAGRILSNAGTDRDSTSMINCTVSGTIEDSMDSILGNVHRAGMTLRAGCGIGYEFSTLRPKGAFVAGSGSSTSGPLSFMEIFDTMCLTISSAGGRRGAQMGTFDVRHPDVIEFIRAKREAGKYRHFNLSLLITDSFIEAVKSDDDWPLHFPITKKELNAMGDPGALGRDIVWSKWSLTPQENYLINKEGLCACRVYKTISAKRLWDMIMTSTYDYAEPGFILIDHANEMNNNWFCEDLRASNPCGEQILPPNGACLLGSINLTKFVKNPFTESARFDFKAFEEVVKVFSRMLDNVVDDNGLPLKEQREEILRKRRHGMGFLGLGSALNMLGLRYGSKEAVKTTEDISCALAVAGWYAARDLAIEKGPAPIMEEDFIVTDQLLSERPEIGNDYQLGDFIKGKVLFARHSKYMQRIAAIRPDLVKELEETGARFTHHSSIAPTGTIALSVGNNASNGIEPSFSLKYKRNVIVPGKKTKEQIDVYAYELLAYKEITGGDDIPEHFTVADDVTPEEHVAMQAAAQFWIDASISKTVNVATNCEFDDFKGIYMDAYKKGLKGCTTFRFNPEVFSGVLVREDDLENTEYLFTTEDGESIKVKGSEMVTYEGEEHNAANLFDSLQSGYYGKL